MEFEERGDLDPLSTLSRTHPRDPTLFELFELEEDWLVIWALEESGILKLFLAKILMGYLSTKE